MGELFRFGNVIIRIWSNDQHPPQVEAFWPSMKKPEAHAKFLLKDFECMESVGFSLKDIRRIQRELKLRHEKIWEAWRSIHEEEN